MNRANWIGAPAFFELNQACLTLTQAFGCHVYLVGSAMTRRDYRDVDVRCILPDEDFARWFPGLDVNGVAHDARWSLLCSSISLWLSKHTGLPIDFQIQRRTEANAEFPRREGHQRHALGLFVEAGNASKGDEG